MKDLKAVRAFLILGICLVMGACGVKPGDVSPPEGTEEKAFPATYPDLSTDPAPARKN